MTYKLAGKALVALVSGAFFCITSVPAGANDPKPNCKVPNDLTRLERPLARVAQRLHTHQAVKIVAIGSSSTAGAGASTPAQSYPSRLQADLRERLPAEKIDVVNLGANGETASDMIARFDSVIAEKPDLVLWQVGSNSVLRDHPILPASALIREGVRLLRAANIDVVLVNLQFAPKILAKHDAEGMVAQIDVAAKELNVSVFRRFSVMRHWREASDISFDTFITPDGLHLNDWGYDCWARLMSAAIIEASSRPVMSATAAPTAPIVPASTKPTP